MNDQIYQNWFAKFCAEISHGKILQLGRPVKAYSNQIKILHENYQCHQQTQNIKQIKSFVLVMFFYF